MKTDSEKELQGTNRDDKKPILDTSRVLTKLPHTPKGLSETAQLVWRDIGVKLIQMGTLTDVDLIPFKRYCYYSGHLEDNLDLMLDPDNTPQELYKWMSIEKRILEFESQYGLTPKSRKALGVGVKKKADTKLMKLIRNKGAKTA
jgi:phage terminase small subunit